MKFLLIQKQGALVVIGGIDIPFWGGGYGDAYKTLARESASLLVENVLDGIMGNPEHMSDPIHPNDRGYAIMAERFYQVVKPYL